MEFNFWRNVNSILPHIQTEPFSELRENESVRHVAALTRIKEAEGFLDQQSDISQVSEATTELFEAYHDFVKVVFGGVSQRRWLAIGSHRFLPLPSRRLISDIKWTNLY